MAALERLHLIDGQFYRAGKGKGKRIGLAANLDNKRVDHRKGKGQLKLSAREGSGS